MAALGFLITTAYWPGIASAAFVPKWAMLVVGLPLVSKMEPRNAGPLMGLILLQLIVLSALSLRMSPDPLGGTLDLYYIVVLCAVFLAGAGECDLDAAFAGIAIGFAVQAPIALLQWYAPGNFLPQGSGYPGALFYTSECYAETAAIVLVWAIVRRRLWLVPGVALPLALCHSRIAIAVSMLGLISAWRPGCRWVKPAVLFALILVAAAAVISLGSAKVTSAGQRVMLWMVTVMSFTPAGHGLGWFYRGHPYEQFTHSDVLQAIAEVGPGAVLLAAIPFAAWRGKRGTRAERAAFVTICAEALVSFPLHFPVTGFLAALLAGRLAGAGPRVRDDAPISRGHHGARLQWA